MKRWLKYTLLILGVLVTLGLIKACSLIQELTGDSFYNAWQDNCAVCHGEGLQGAPQGPPLVNRPLSQGDSLDNIIQSISVGNPDLGMPAFGESLDEDTIRSLAIFIVEQREGMSMDSSRMDAPLAIPEDTINTELASFRVETVASGIDPFPFSIAPLPDGRILLTEREKGLSIITKDGERSAPIPGAPPTQDDGNIRWGLNYGAGWHLDVKPHPDYSDNGWIYLHHTDLCTDCDSPKMVGMFQKTMNRLVRGRIQEGEWVDQEVIWSVPEENYKPYPDLGAGGRLAFDDTGHVYVSVGMRGSNYEGPQELDSPYGKIHRVKDDGTLPADNPFAHTEDAMASIWTVGHRSPQGLEFDPETRLLWGSEMGPRGGDEINLLEPGRNYGWPLTSKGLNYNGTEVDYGPDLGIDWKMEDIEQPVVDLTPSPAVSSFIIYYGDAFPAWRGHFLVGSLKATTLYRMVIDDGQLMHTEVLVSGIGRIRDIESGPGGHLYLLLEQESGSQIVRLAPADP